MTDFAVRTIDPEEQRAAAGLFMEALHRPASVTNEEWARLKDAFQPGRTLAAFDPRMIGTARSFDAELTVPGGSTAPAAAVTGVGVRADRTRRGVLTELMRVQLTELRERAVPLAILLATEGEIYGRYGYGVATQGRWSTIDRRRARFRPEVPTGGEVELLDSADAVARLPEIYAALGAGRPGRMTRPDYWWAAFEVIQRRANPLMRSVIHHGPDGPDGFAIYSVEGAEPGKPGVLEVSSLHAAGDAASADLWRFLLSVDLVDRVRVRSRPVDEPLELLFTDPRACRYDWVKDELWLRLVDVPAALAAREYSGDGVVVLDVVDPLLAANSGRYAVSRAGVTRTDAPAELRLGVDTLAMLYLGAWRASALASVGRIEVLDPAAAARADSLFGTRVSSWCGTVF
ncbi:GNAT family N-acetyltransferase [Amycolatopsis anabasis]|uniref:GNAT family N-acetyltransferase n=1 Tax=Amycolatopsis anabasis TaxID=1840409 RepID=UPI00131C207B|nr:GNAT family N-acetyltransferase [Amycolatopsis anabasis]